MTANRQLRQLSAVQRIKDMRLRVAEEALQRAARAEQEMRMHCAQLQRQLIDIQQRPATLAQAAMRNTDLGTLRALPELRAAAMAAAEEMHEQIKPAQQQLQQAEQRRHAMAHNMQQQRMQQKCLQENMAKHRCLHARRVADYVMEETLDVFNASTQRQRNF